MSHYESLRVEARRRTLGKCVTQVSEQHAPAHEAPILPAPPEPGAGARVRIDSGTLMQKLLPSHLVEPYLTSQRSVITGFVHRAEDIALPGPAWLLAAADAGGPGRTCGYCGGAHWKARPTWQPARPGSPRDQGPRQDGGPGPGPGPGPSPSPSPSPGPAPAGRATGPTSCSWRRGPSRWVPRCTGSPRPGRNSSPGTTDRPGSGPGR